MYNRQKSSVVDDTDASGYDEKSDVLSHIPDFFDQDEQQQNEKTLDLSISASQSHLKYLANFWDVLSFGICVAAANIFIAWGSGFRQGFWDFFFATVVSSFSFINLFLCIAELVSIVPYGGGAYALARVTAGPYIGFLVGCCESIGNIVFAFVAMLPLGTTITYIFDGDPQYEPLYWLIIYGVVIGAEFAGRKFYFSFLRFVAFLSLSIITLYFIVSFQQINPDKYIPDLLKSTYRGGIIDAFPLLMPAGWWYYGIEIMPLINDEVRNAKENSPKAIILTVAIVTFLAFVCIVFAYCQYPSYEDDKVFLLQSLPLNSGFSNAFGITDQMATILSYPGLYISNALFIYGYGKQLRALAKSKLLPSFLSLTLTDSNIPYVALLLGSLIGYIALAVLNKGYGNNYDSPIMVELFNAALMGSYFTFEVMFISFIIFRNRYSNLSRSFTNPLGIYGAIAGMIGFGFLSISLVGYTYDNFHAFYMFLVFIALSSLYYYFYARYNQIFSEEEQAVMFRVYLMKANQRRIHSRLRIKKHHLNGRKFRKQSLRSEDNSIAISLASGATATNYQMVHGRSVSKVHIAPPPLVQSPSILEDELMSVSSPRDLDVEGT